MTRIGLTLPSFEDDPDVPIALAAAAESAGLDGVFVFDHMFRRGADGHRRPAIEATALLGAVAAETHRIAVGTLVARASLRPPATLAVALESAARVAGGRMLATLGAGDAESREENEAFGVDFGTLDRRVRTLRDAVVATRDRGFPVWVGGTAAPVLDVAAAEADGWNRWGGSPEAFARDAAALRGRSRRAPFTCSWGGLVVLADDDAAAVAKAARLGAGPHVVAGGPAGVAVRLRRYVEAGADWVVLGPVDSSDPANADRLAEVAAALSAG